VLETWAQADGRAGPSAPAGFAVATWSDTPASFTPKIFRLENIFPGSHPPESLTHTAIDCTHLREKGRSLTRPPAQKKPLRADNCYAFLVDQ
jgi:hypothetical protein